MYYELKWIEWPSGEEWFAIANSEQEIEQFVEDAANDEKHDFEYCGYVKVEKTPMEIFLEKYK